MVPGKDIYDQSIQHSKQKIKDKTEELYRLERELNRLRLESKNNSNVDTLIDRVQQDVNQCYTEHQKIDLLKQNVLKQVDALIAKYGECSNSSSNIFSVDTNQNDIKSKAAKLLEERMKILKLSQTVSSSNNQVERDRLNRILNIKSAINELESINMPSIPKSLETLVSNPLIVKDLPKESEPVHVPIEHRPPTPIAFDVSILSSNLTIDSGNPFEEQIESNSMPFNIDDNSHDTSSKSSFDSVESQTCTIPNFYISSPRILSITEAPNLPNRDKINSLDPFSTQEDLFSGPETILDYALDQYMDNMTWPMNTNPVDAYYFGIAMYDYPDTSESTNDCLFVKWDLVIVCRHSLPILKDSVISTAILNSYLQPGNTESGHWIYGIATSLQENLNDNEFVQAWFPTNYIAWLPRAKVIRSSSYSSLHHDDIILCLSIKRSLFLHPLSGRIVQLTPDQWQWIDISCESDNNIFHVHSVLWDILGQHPLVWPLIHQDGGENWCLRPLPLSLPQSLSHFNRKWLESIHELLASECRYIQRLNTIIQVFSNPLKFELLSNSDYSLIFGPIPKFTQYHEDLLRACWINRPSNQKMDLEMIFNILSKEHSIDIHNRENVFKYLFQAFDGFLSDKSVISEYISFCSKQSEASQRLLQLRKTNQSLNDFLMKCTSDERCSGLDLSSYLLEPMQRITRYPLLFKQILHYTESLDMQKSLNTLISKVEYVLGNANMAASKQSTNKKIEQLMSKCDPYSRNQLMVRWDIFSPGMTLLKDGPLRKSKSKRPLHAYLFSKILLLLDKTRGHFHGEYSIYRNPILIDSITRVQQTYGNPLSFQIFHGSGLCTALTVGSDESDCDHWITLIQEARHGKHDIENEQKNSPEPKSGSLNVTVFQINNLPKDSKLIITYNGRYPSKTFSSTLFQSNCTFPVQDPSKDFLQLNIVKDGKNNGIPSILGHPCNVQINVVNSCKDHHTDILEYDISLHSSDQDSEPVKVALMLSLQL